MAGIEDAQARWAVIQSRGRTRGIIALIVVVLIVLAIALLAGSNASVVLIVLIVAALLVGAIVVTVGKRKTGLAITPEWKPETDRGDYDDFDDDAPAVDAPATGEPTIEAQQPETAEDAAEPIRRLDAQILGADLSKLGQVVSPKLAKSYAVGTLVLEGSDIVWEPGTVSRAAGIENLVAAPAQVTMVETAPLWGSWGLIRVATAGGDEWCLRVPGSVDLSPAFAELGLTLKKS